MLEIARRQEETQIPLKTAQEAQTAAAEWMRIAFVSFLSAESRALLGIRDVGQWKHYAMERFKGILDFTLKNADRTRSAIPAWALERIEIAWNIEDRQEAEPG
jgi:hypothetical protein